VELGERAAAAAADGRREGGGGGRKRRRRKIIYSMCKGNARYSAQAKMSARINRTMCMQCSMDVKLLSYF
jgi:hypothetical protein